MWRLNIFIEKQTKLFFNKSWGNRNTYTTTNAHKTREKQERLILDALRLKMYYPFFPLYFYYHALSYTESDSLGFG